MNLLIEEFNNILKACPNFRKLIQDCPYEIIDLARFLIDIIDSGRHDDCFDLNPLIEFMEYFFSAVYKPGKQGSKVSISIPNKKGNLTVHRCHSAKLETKVYQISKYTGNFRIRFQQMMGFDFEQFLRIVFDELEKRKGV